MWGATGLASTWGFGAIAASLSVDKSYYTVGDQMTYIIQGAIPDSSIVWSSFKDGKSTGEYQSNYGQKVGANGTWEETVSVPDAGRWEKVALIIAPDGSQSVAQAFFQVVAKQEPSGGTPVSTGGSFLSGSVSLAGFQVPVLLIVGVVAYLVFKKR